MKRRILLLMIITAFILSACSRDNEEVRTSSEESTVSFQEETKSEEVTAAAPDVPASDKEAEISYTGEEFKKSVFAVGGDMLFVCGIKSDESYFLGYMKQEENIFQEISVELPADMRVFNMTVDNQNRCHMLWMSVEKLNMNGESFDTITYEKSYITVINEKGEIENNIDVSSVFNSEQRRPFCFVTDGEGNYYFENGKDIVKLQPDGSSFYNIVCAGWIEGIGIGKDGMVYCTCESDSGGKLLGRLEENTFVPCEADLPDSNAIYGGIAAGTDADIMIYNKSAGVYTYDDAANAVELRIPLTQLPLSGEEVAGYGFLRDGRLCLLGQNGGTTFYYIPAGR